MSDFRVPFDLSSDVIFELDWNRQSRCWTVSEREVGLGNSWIESLTPTNDQLRALLTFFRIRIPIPSQSLIGMSPGELVTLSVGSGCHDIYAVFCERCYEHWYVYRWEPEENHWAVYGRNCDFTWRRGDPVQNKDIERLASLRSDLTSDPLSPPC